MKRHKYATEISVSATKKVRPLREGPLEEGAVNREGLAGEGAPSSNPRTYNDDDPLTDDFMVRPVVWCAHVRARRIMENWGAGLVLLWFYFSPRLCILDHILMVVSKPGGVLSMKHARLKSACQSLLVGVVAFGVVVTGGGVAQAKPATAGYDQNQVVETITVGNLKATVNPDSSTVTSEIGSNVSALTLPGSVSEAVRVEADDIPDELFEGVGEPLLTTTLPEAMVSTFAAENGTQTLIKIDSAQAPTEYRFPLSLPDGARAEVTSDGSIAVTDDEGTVTGEYKTPWAYDANGSPVPTRFALEGNVLVQSIGFSTTTAFPVVADPFWIPALFVVARLTAHAVSQAAARGVSQALIRQVVQNGVRSAGQKGTTVFTQGKGVNRIRVIVDTKSGRIITVTKG